MVARHCAALTVLVRSIKVSLTSIIRLSEAHGAMLSCDCAYGQKQHCSWDSVAADGFYLISCKRGTFRRSVVILHILGHFYVSMYRNGNISTSGPNFLSPSFSATLISYNEIEIVAISQHFGRCLAAFSLRVRKMRRNGYLCTSWQNSDTAESSDSVFL